MNWSAPFKEALYHVAMETDAFHWRRICRFYSETFHTPLHQVYTLPANLVLQAYYEARMEKKSREDLLDLAIETLAPDLARELSAEKELAAQQVNKAYEEQSRKGVSLLSFLRAQLREGGDKGKLKPLDAPKPESPANPDESSPEAPTPRDVQMVFPPEEPA